MLGLVLHLKCLLYFFIIFIKHFQTKKLKKAPRVRATVGVKKQRWMVSLPQVCGPARTKRPGHMHKPLTGPPWSSTAVLCSVVSYGCTLIAVNVLPCGLWVSSGNHMLKLLYSASPASCFFFLSMSKSNFLIWEKKNCPKLSQVRKKKSGLSMTSLSTETIWTTLWCFWIRSTLGPEKTTGFSTQGVTLVFIVHILRRELRKY